MSNSKKFHQWDWEAGKKASERWISLLQFCLTGEDSSRWYLMKQLFLFWGNKGYINLVEWKRERTLLARVEVLGMLHLQEEEFQVLKRLIRP